VSGGRSVARIGRHFEANKDDPQYARRQTSQEPGAPGGSIAVSSLVRCCGTLTIAEAWEMLA